MNSIGIYIVIGMIIIIIIKLIIDWNSYVNNDYDYNKRDSKFGNMSKKDWVKNHKSFFDSDG